MFSGTMLVILLVIINVCFKLFKIVLQWCTDKFKLVFFKEFHKDVHTNWFNLVVYVCSVGIVCFSLFNIRMVNKDIVKQDF